MDYTEKQVRESKTGAFSITETKTRIVSGATPGPWTVSVIVSLAQAQFSTLTQARNALAAIVADLDGLLGG